MKKKKTPIKKKPKVSKYWDLKPSEGESPPINNRKAIPLGIKPVNVTNLRNARKLLSRIIYLSQIDAIDDGKAKSLTYLLSVFISLYKEGELEQRITALEQRTGGNG